MSTDPVQLLDRLRPPEGWDAHTDLDTDPVAAQILERVFADTGNVVSLDAARRRRRRGIAGTIVVAALVAGGAVAAFWSRSPDETRQVACYSDAQGDPAQIVGMAWDGESDPAALCTTEWTNGALGAAAPPGGLQACVTDDGIVAVLPGDRSVCEAMGIAEFSFEIDDMTLAVNRATRELDRVLFVSENCVPLAEAEEETQRVLAKYGLSGWTIEIAGAFGTDEPCAVVALDSESTTAFVSSVPRPF